ncbi:MAG: EF-hand domain-containing protein [Methylobacter sp.]
MKIKKSVYEISDVINMHPLDQTNLNFFKIFSLPVWLVIISISLSFVSNSVRAGTEDAKFYYRYVPYQGPSSTTGTGSQKPTQPSGTSGAEAKKAEQATSTGEKGGTTGQGTQQGGQAATGQGTQQGSQGATGQSTQQGGQAATGQSTQQGGQAATGQSTQQGSQDANRQTTQQGSMSGEQKPYVHDPKKSIGEFPSPSTPTFAQIDVNGDHYVTKDELKDFPELLKVFDKVDAGKDGKLEQHEFSNLEAETSREGEI